MLVMFHFLHVHPSLSLINIFEILVILLHGTLIQGTNIPPLSSSLLPSFYSIIVLLRIPSGLGFGLSIEATELLKCSCGVGEATFYHTQMF